MAKQWYQIRRHLYVICINPANPTQYFTFSAEPDRTSNPWTLKFCAENELYTLIDINAVISEKAWGEYNVAAIQLSKEVYPIDKLISSIQIFRSNSKKLPYSIEVNGYDCQAATRDVLQATNPSIDANSITLPPLTELLAYRSSQSLSLATESSTSPRAQSNSSRPSSTGVMIGALGESVEDEVVLEESKDTSVTVSISDPPAHDDQSDFGIRM